MAKQEDKFKSVISHAKEYVTYSKVVKSTMDLAQFMTTLKMEQN